ncbi:HD domain-containing protein 2 isoform X2 [Megalobrama amblycephala]|uniref:HD domain-containing protein 2 isoform X2 n=1 Tax=Megalobrama amblycephala TaxID=75352 RepID=UPI0020146B58|nr:HD domain-containing protein 2 isoform X2 [Megalobrama amblycephala]
MLPLSCDLDLPASVTSLHSHSQILSCGLIICTLQNLAGSFRCMKLALVHDLAECIVGDIAPADNVSKAEKHRREKEAMVHITGLLDDGLRKEIYSLWEEYENQSSPEAKLVKELDQLEMIIQAHEYEELEGKPGRLQEFFTSTEGRFHHPEVLGLVKSLNEERARHIAAGGDDTAEKTPDTSSHTTATP